MRRPRQDGHQARHRADQGLRPGHARGHAVPRRPEPAPGGPPGHAGPHPRQPPGVLRPVGEDLGVPGTAQGHGPRRATWRSAGATRTRSRRLSGRRPRGRTSSRTCRRCAAGCSTRCRRTWRAASSSWALAGCATSSSPSSCCSSCTATPMSGCASPPRCARSPPSRTTATWAARTPRNWPPRTASCGRPSTCFRSTSSVAPTRCRRTRPCCAASAARSALASDR